MMNKQSMRPSQTMPQLFYTRQDIQEQYLSTTKVRQQQQELASSNTSSSNNFNNKANNNQKSSKRARSSDPKYNKEFEEYESDQDDGEGEGEGEDSSSNDASRNNNSNNAQENNGGSRAGRSRARAKAESRKRRKRARSASLFSACFTIPNLGSILTSQTASGSTSAGNNTSSGQPLKRSILSHLGLGQKFSSPPTTATTIIAKNKRPISASQTAGNLHQIGQEAATSSQQTSSPANNGARKHVSFGGAGSQQKQQQQQQMVSAQTSSQDNTEHGFNEQAASQQLGGSNNVIMRSYQAHDQPRVAAQAKTQETSGKTTRGVDMALETAPSRTGYNEKIDNHMKPAAAARPKQQQQEQSPIYLVSQVANTKPHHMPTTGPRRTANPAQAIYLNHPANNVVSNQPQPQSQCHQVPTSNLAHRQNSNFSTAPLDQQQLQNSEASHYGDSQSRSYPSHAHQPSYLMHHHHHQQQQQQQQRGLSSQQTGQQGYHQTASSKMVTKATLYKRLPSVPMRTQATQTEITAYHLMATPPLSSGASSVVGVGQPPPPPPPLDQHSLNQQQVQQRQHPNQRQQKHVCQMQFGSPNSGASRTAHDTPMSSGVPSVSQTPDKQSPLREQSSFSKVGQACGVFQPETMKTATATSSKSPTRGDRVRETKIEEQLAADGSDEWSVDELDTDRALAVDLGVGVSGKSAVRGRAGATKNAVASETGEEEADEIETGTEIETETELTEGEPPSNTTIKAARAQDGGIEAAPQSKHITMGECGNFEASTLASPCTSSCSSSAASLVGHDSALAAKLLKRDGEAEEAEDDEENDEEETKKVVRNKGAATAITEANYFRQQKQQHQHQREDYEHKVAKKLAKSGQEQDIALANDTSIMIRSNDQEYVERLKVKLKNDNNRATSLLQTQQSLVATTTKTNTKTKKISSEPDIEPPIQFKDNSSFTSELVRDSSRKVASEESGTNVEPSLSHSRLLPTSSFDNISETGELEKRGKLLQAAEVVSTSFMNMNAGVKNLGTCSNELVMSNEEEEEEGEEKQCELDLESSFDRAPPSPPSLSEASSQTDASLAPNIHHFDIPSVGHNMTRPSGRRESAEEKSDSRKGTGMGMKADAPGSSPSSKAKLAEHKLKLKPTEGGESSSRSDSARIRDKDLSFDKVCQKGKEDFEIQQQQPCTSLTAATKRRVSGEIGQNLVSVERQFGQVSRREDEDEDGGGGGGGGKGQRRAERKHNEEESKLTTLADRIKKDNSVCSSSNLSGQPCHEEAAQISASPSGHTNRPPRSSLKEGQPISLLATNLPSSSSSSSSASSMSEPRRQKVLSEFSDKDYGDNEQPLSEMQDEIIIGSSGGNNDGESGRIRSRINESKGEEGVEKSDLLSLLDNEELELSECSGICPASKQVPPFSNALLTGPSQSPVSEESKRRDEFLALAADELVAIAEAGAKNGTGAGDAASLAALACSSSSARTSKRRTSTATKSTTSTLSTRHHSYCSNDDFASYADQTSSPPPAGSITSPLDNFQKSSMSIEEELEQGCSPINSSSSFARESKQKVSMEKEEKGSVISRQATIECSPAPMFSKQADPVEPQQQQQSSRRRYSSTAVVNPSTVIVGQQQQQQQRKSSFSALEPSLGFTSLVSNYPQAADNGSGGVVVVRSDNIVQEHKQKQRRQAASPLEFQERGNEQGATEADNLPERSESHTTTTTGGVGTQTRPLEAAKLDINDDDNSSSGGSSSNNNRLTETALAEEKGLLVAANGADKSGFNETIKRNWKADKMAAGVGKEGEGARKKLEARQGSGNGEQEEARVRFMIASGYKNLDQQDELSIEGSKVGLRESPGKNIDSLLAMQREGEQEKGQLPQTSQAVGDDENGRAKHATSEEAPNKSSSSSSSPSSSSNNSCAASPSLSSSTSSSGSTPTASGSFSLGNHVESTETEAAAGTTMQPPKTAAVSGGSNLDSEQQQQHLEQHLKGTSLARGFGQATNVPLRKSSDSPPTTVSELDEELSTPSFVDNYKRRMAQVCQVAESVVCELMDECLGEHCKCSALQESQQQQQQQHQHQHKSASFELRDGKLMGIDGKRRASEHLPFKQLPSRTMPAATTFTGAKPGAEPVAECSSGAVYKSSSSKATSLTASSSTASNSLTSTTSLSGDSYVCCHPNEPLERQAEKQRPRVPKKPAYLQKSSAASASSEQRADNRKESAASQAIAVTATTIAAAAVLHTSYKPASQHGRVCLIRGKAARRVGEANQSLALAGTEEGEEAEKEVTQAKQVAGSSDETALPVAFSSADYRQGVNLMLTDESQAAQIQRQLQLQSQQQSTIETGAAGRTGVSETTSWSQTGSFDVPGGAALTCSRSGSNSSSLANSVIVAGRRLSTTSTPEMAETSRQSAIIGLVESSGSELEEGEGTGSSTATSNFADSNVAAAVNAPTANTGSGVTTTPSPSTFAIEAGRSNSTSASTSISSSGHEQSGVAPPAELKPRAALEACSGSPQSIGSKSFTATTSSSNSKVTNSASSSTSNSHQATFGSTGNEEPKTGTTADGSLNSSSSEQVVRGEQEDPGEKGSEQLVSEQQQQQLTQAAGNSSQEHTFPIRRASQELSTVSEVSEEMSNGQSNLLANKQQQQQAKQAMAMEREVGSGSENNAREIQRTLEAPKAHNNEQITLMQDPATEHDLAHSEYTLRSQLSEETPAMLSEETSGSSEHASNTNIEPLDREQVSETTTTTIGKQATSCKSSEEQVISGALTTTAKPTTSNQLASNSRLQSPVQQQPMAVQQQQQSQLQQQEQRRRSSGSGANSSSPSPIQSTTRPAHGMKSPVDCPYVRDILPLSPDSRSPPLPLTSVGGVPGQHLISRLSHDDTMEAIEDDIEGEELEMMEQMKQQQLEQVEPLSIAPPPAFSGDQQQATVSHSADRTSTPAESIKEENEDEQEEEEEEEEESSISVSQHGVIVSQEAPALKRRRSTSSNTPSATTSGQLTPSNTLDTSGKQIHEEQLKNYPGNYESADLDKQAEYKRQVDENKNAVESQKLSKESSADSGGATQAILEHLSKHHRDLTLDEPSPTLEHSRSVDPQLRRESWRRESTRKQTSTITASDEQARQYGMGDSSAGRETRTTTTTTTSNTGTMKRKSKTNKTTESSSQDVATTLTNNEDDNAEGKVVETRKEREEENEGEAATTTTLTRGPPLAQTKLNLDATSSKQVNSLSQSQSQSQGGQQVVTRQSSVSLPTDTSICSSCSCLEEVYEDQQQPVVVSARGQAGTCSTAIATTTTATATLASGPCGERAAWMSQEEGTVFTENYWLAHWLYISEHEESEIWRRAIDMNPPGGESSEQQLAQAGSSLSTRAISQELIPGMPKDMTEVGSTSSERSFSAKYKSTTRKMIHRRASIEMYKRIMNNNLKREKRVEISRSNGEFGFRIHGSRPVVVSAIERGTSAETCGLQVGDLIYAINGTNILDMAHSDVVKLAHSADSSSLVLDLVPTNDFLRMSKYNKASNKHHEPTVTGYLMRLSPSTAQPLLVELQDQMSQITGVSSQQRAKRLNEVMRLAWRQRYFVLRSDNCLYWYRSPNDIEPYGGINLQGFSASLTNEFSEPNYVIRLVKYAGQPHYLGTNNICDIQTWVDAINKAATEANQDDPYMKRTLTLARTKPNSIPEPDCSGYLYKFSHKRGGGAHWRAAYFVLKDACLYLFKDQQADFVNQASAVYYLHGYRVRHKHIEHKKHTFELVPPNRKTIRPIFLMANSDIDKKRWIAALEYSIDRWIEID